jgi:hypothetical protein
VAEERGRIVTANRGASSAALREQVQVRSFSLVLAITIGVMFLLAVAVALLGWWHPTMIPLCFKPEEAGTAMVVCPMEQSDRYPATAPVASAQQARAAEDIDYHIAKTAKPLDLVVVELIGLLAAAISAASTISKIRGSSERTLIPAGLAVLKLPTGAITAILGLLLMRGQFVPGLSALDSSAQILAWALVFGYAQQAFTRLVDRQAHVVLDNVRGADKQQV